MEKNRVRERVLAGEQVLGAMLGLGSPTAAELMGHAGYDFLVIEAEHSPLDLAQIQEMLMAVGNTPATPIVRVPSSEPLFIQRALDAGGEGLLVPMVKSAEEAAAVVSATRYPPVGTRGFGPLRASKYTFDYPGYFADANDNILISLILETREMLDNLEAIASIDGIDAIFCGLFDLCISLGLDPMAQPLQEIEDAMERAREICRRCGTAIGVGCSAEELRQRQDQGFRFHICGTDYSLLGNAARAGVEAFRSL